MRRKFADGSFVSTMYAIFDGEKQATRWDPRKDKVISAFRRSNPAHKPYSIRRKAFITPAREKGGAS